MSLVVHYTQQLFFSSLLRTVAGWKFNLIARPRSGSGSGISIDEFIPLTLGYHPDMEMYVGTNRKYVLPPPDLSIITETETVTDGMAYRYCIMTDENYCPLLLAKLLVMRNVIVLDIQSTEIRKFYESCTLTPDQTPTCLPSSELRKLAEVLYQAYTKIPCNLPVQPFQSPTVMLDDEEPGDMRAKGYNALVTTEKSGAQHLVLSPTNGPDTLPNVTIITRLPSNVTKVQQMLLHKCWLDNRYPVDKITWIVESDNHPSWWTWGGDRIIPRSPSLDPSSSPSSSSFVVEWDLDHYYYPHSIYAKIKLLMDNPEVLCVGSDTEGCIDISRPSNGCIRRPRSGPVGIAYRDGWKGYRNTYMDMPFNFNTVQIKTTNAEDIIDESVKVIKLLDDDMKSFIGKLNRLKK